MTDLYYKAPNNKIFEEVKKAAIEIWNTYDNTYGYASEKVDRIKDLKNVSDNFMFIVAMFDSNNQSRLGALISPEARYEIYQRMLAGGVREEFIPYTITLAK